MKNIFSILICMQFFVMHGESQLNVQNLLTENLVNPIGLDIREPRFTWQLVDARRNVVQTACEIKVSSGKTSIWKSGKIISDQSVHVLYSGSPLQSGKKYEWQVRVWDNTGAGSEWSKPAFFQIALLNTDDWKAKWISAGFVEDSVDRPPVIFRKEFSANKKIATATAYITAHGMYEAQINGKKVGDACLAPGWTSYNARLQYQVYDVAGLLVTGKNAVGASVANGWYRGNLAWGGKKNIYGTDASLLFQVNIEYQDGSNETIISDESWKSSTGSIQYAEIYHGETIDARKEKNGWATSSFSDTDWSGVKTTDHPKNILVATYNEPIRKHEAFKPVTIFKTPKGEQVIDFGQNLVGWVILKVKGSAGDKVSIHHAEVLDKYGNFYTDNIREARATATYILNGKGEELFEPHFTFYGFRYIRVEGFPGEIKPENFTAVALYSAMRRSGEFSSSNSLVNQLQHNIEWGQKGNFLDVPTDCPQRDERLGWTGDAQVFARTAAFNRNVNNFFAKWLKDVAADQQPDGSVPYVVPNVLGPNSVASAGWADVATIIPWNMWLAYGDKKILADQYSSMKAWVEFMRKKTKDDLWNTGFHFGDWLFYRPDDDNDGRAAVTDKYLIAQCFYAHSTQLLINAAKVLGKIDDVTIYTGFLKKIKDAFVKEYATPGGRLVSSTQTAYVLALNFDMLPESWRPEATAKLVANIKSYGNHLTTGFLGTPYLCHVLTRFGYNDIAYTLLLQETFPSWLYPVKRGATTIWERWNGIKPDSTFAPATMNSFNHYAYGAIGDWMYRVMAGLDTYEDGVGYKHSKIKPHIGGGFKNVSASLQTYYGKLSCGWKDEGDKIVMDVEIPANTSATVFVPAKNAEAVTESGNPLSSSKDVQVTGMEDGYVVLRIGSGIYHFSVAK